MLRAQQTNEVNFGLQQAAGANILLGIQQIMGNMINPQVILQLSQQIALAHQGGMINTVLLGALQRDLTQLAQTIPDQQFFNILGNQLDANVQAHIQHQLNNALQNIPTLQQVTDLQRQLQQAMTANDRARANQIADALQQILHLDPVSVQQIQQIKAELMGEMGVLRHQVTGLTDEIKQNIIDQLEFAGIENKRTLNSVKSYLEVELKAFTSKEIASVTEELIRKLNEVRDSGEHLTSKVIKDCVKDAIVETMSEQKASMSPSPSGPTEMEEIQRGFKPRQLRYPVRMSSVNDDIMEEPFGVSSSSLSSNPNPDNPSLISPTITTKTNIPSSETKYIKATLKQLEDFVKPPLHHRSKPLLIAYIKLMKSRLPDVIVDEIKIPKNLSDKTSISELRRIEKAIHEKVLELTTANMYELFHHGGGGGKPAGGKGLHRIHGSGLSKKPSVILQTDFSQGIMPTHKYVPFGRYFIDHHRINDDILSLRRGNGVNIVGLPVRRLSKDLGEVVRTILKDEHPSYNQIEKLSKEEKDYLYKIAKSSNILDRLHIPSPTKEEDDQDINQFEILKGELLCGNDGTETIKKFKVLVMRMMNKGLLPKGQAKEILLDLATMGY
jgi:hypothetical protein